MTSMTYKELNSKRTSLNANIAELEKQLSELSSQREEVEAHIQKHKQSVIDNYINLVNRLIDTQQELLEIGIDPTTIDMSNVASDIEETTEIESDSSVALDRTMEGEHVAAPTMEPSETSIEIEEAEVAEDMVMEEKEDNIEDLEGVSLPLSKKGKSTLLKPFFYVWGLRKGAFKKNCSVLEWKQSSPRLQTSWLKLTKAPVNRAMNMGNTMYRPTYSTPDDGRVYSAYGIAPTLTAIHGDITVRIGTDPRSIEPISTAA